MIKKWMKDLNIHLTKKDIQMENNLEKMLDILCH